MTIVSSESRAQIIVTPTVAYVRFHRVGDRRFFHQFIGSFYSEVPEAEYDGQLGYQVIPLNCLGHLLAFCDGELGLGHVDIQFRRGGFACQASLFD